MKQKKQKKKFTVALVQMAVEKNTNANLKRATKFIEKAAKKRADVVCLPELFRSLYFCQKEDPKFFDIAEKIPGQTTQVLSKSAKNEKIVIIAPIFEKRAAGIYHNSAVILDADGKMAGLYRKMHIPDDPLYYEKFYFTPGDLGFQAFDTHAGKIATLICWDQWYPEAARLSALQGAHILFYPTAIGWHPFEKDTAGPAQNDAWRTIQRGHAIANAVYVAAANRVGHEIPDGGGDGIIFWGSSFICNPQGVMIAEASIDKEEIIYGEVDMSLIEETRRNWPFLRDRRIDAYEGITRRFIDESSPSPKPPACAPACASHADWSPAKGRRK